MKILEEFIAEYQAQHLKENRYEKSIEGEVQRVKAALLQEQFLPSLQLKNILNKQLRRCHYPIEIAIVGQFSSGKSTFLNALLSKDVLPMGITPVTSKVTYINYAEEYRLKITYKSGVEKYLPVEEIAKFNDQREAVVDDIKYLTIYAPIELLKEISFVDTPGLNSRSQADTQETLKALNDVGGIIWLSLIDNAGKLSEEETLEQYMQNFQEKSLCILNQKDKFTHEQIEATKEYIESKFSKYFTKVTPISAKMALQARVQQKDLQLQAAEQKFLDLITEAIKKGAYDVSFYTETYKQYSQELVKIEQSDYSHIVAMQKESNIDEVLEFIESVLVPHARDAKVFAIQKDLRGICEILLEEYRVLMGVYMTLMSSLESAKEDVLQQFDRMQEVARDDLEMLFVNFSDIITDIASQIYQNISLVKENLYEQKSSFLSQESYSKKEIELSLVDMERVNKALFYDDQTVEKMIKKFLKRLDSIDANIQLSFDDTFAIVKEKILTWQKPYELIKKNREISSDLEFSATRHFASKAFETLLQYYYYVFYENLDKLHQKVSYFKGSIEKYPFSIVDSTLHYLQDRVYESLELHKNDPQSFALYRPREEDIIKSLQDGFKFEELESFLISNRNYIKSTIMHTKEEYQRVHEERMAFIQTEVRSLEGKMQEIEMIQKSIISFEV